MIKNPIYVEVDENIDRLSEKVLQELLFEKLDSLLFPNLKYYNTYSTI